MTDKPTAEAPKRPEIVDPHNVPATFVDWTITGGRFEGIVNLTLGTIDHTFKRSDDELARIIVAMRLRCSEHFAFRLYRTLGDILGLPAPQDEGNPDESPPSPPKNMIN